MSERPRQWTIRANSPRIDDESVIGLCQRCQREFPAIGLIPVDQLVPNRDGTMRHIYGWFCAGCRKRSFGRPNGKPRLGIEMPPLDGSPLNQKKGGLSEPLPPLGTPSRRMSATMTPRKRKMSLKGKFKPMKRLI